MPWVFAEQSDIGGRAQQQDRLQIFSGPGERHLAVVADGMGGHESGTAAAQAVVEIAGRHFNEGDASDPQAFLLNLCLAAHHAINALAQGDALSPGSTCVLLYTHGPEAYWVHVGDGRLYHFRAGEVVARTRDHSLAQLLQERGRLDGADRSLQNQIYMRLGGDKLPEPDFACVAVEPRDVFLLCSDGLWDHVDSIEAASLLAGNDLAQASARLVALARDRGGEAGDNISVVLATWV